MGCTKEQMIVIIEERKLELSKHPFLIGHINDTNKNKVLADQLICRTNKDVG